MSSAAGVVFVYQRLQNIRLAGAVNEFRHRSQRNVQTHLIVRNSRDQPAALSRPQFHQAVPRHRLQSAREIGFLSPCESRQFGERVRLLLRDQRQQLAVALGKHPRKTLDRREPDGRLALRGLVLSSRDRHGASLHPLESGNAGYQCFHGIEPLRFSGRIVWSCRRIAKLDGRHGPSNIVFDKGAASVIFDDLDGGSNRKCLRRRSKRASVERLRSATILMHRE